MFYGVDVKKGSFNQTLMMQLCSMQQIKHITFMSAAATFDLSITQAVFVYMQSLLQSLTLN